MNTNPIMVLDLETGSANGDKCVQHGLITQIAACIINPRTLEIDPNSYFNSECKPENLTEVEEDALKVTRKTREGLEKSPPLKEVWGNFREYVKNYNGKTKWNRVVRAGYNILSFDNIILNGMCNKFGDIDKDGKQNLFSDFMNIDLMPYIWMLTENNNTLSKFSTSGKADIKFDTVCRWLGVDTTNSHDALIDVKREARVIARFIKLFRTLMEKVPFENSMVNEVI